MAWKTLTAKKTMNTFGLGKTDPATGKTYPSEIKGYYLGSRVVLTSNGESPVHIFKTSSGEQSIWGTAYLNNHLPEVPVGSHTTVKLNGKKERTKKGFMNLFDISYNDEDTIGTSGVEDLSDVGEGLDFDDTPPPKSSNEARVKALLNKNK